MKLPVARRKRATIGGVWWKALIREVRFCQRCGEPLIRKFIKEEKRWRRACRSCGFVHYFNPKVVAGAIPVIDGKVVLGRRSIEPAKGRWGFPCGYVEWGESVEEAAIRETHEEIGLKVKIRSLLGVYSYSDAGVATVVYVAHAPRSQKPQSLQETDEVKIFSKKQIPWDELAFRSTRHALRDWADVFL
jgi:ADP-ribose pyrophosphatase YjhB (NUDIX family)